MSKKYKKFFLLTMAIYFVFISSATVVLSATQDTQPGKMEYVPLEPNAFPGVSSDAGGGDIGLFLGQMFNFGIAIAVVLALIEIIWGGVEYMTTDSWFTKTSGKERIYSALIGLGIALASYIILYTINPDLVDFSKNTLFVNK